MAREVAFEGLLWLKIAHCETTLGIILLKYVSVFFPETKEYQCIS
jgi:hypothetical protein